jgi:hypothetical protein
VIIVQAKMGCLDKSKLDWEQFVEQEGIKEELTTFNKGKHGYVNFFYVSIPLNSFPFCFHWHKFPWTN